ncbi:MAG: ribonuclease HII [Sphaerochaetaceae bacterium]|nr:ribonuclease HII [Sphaerochaetaceae bacterium]
MASVQQELFEIEPLRNICGIDEAGRGPLAGPVCAAAVVLPPDFDFSLLGDSKRLTAKQREKAELYIKGHAIAWAVAWATHKEIDELNILRATMLAMRRAYDKVAARTQVSIVLVDGNKEPDLPCPCQAIVKGDAKVHEIMAASILAKTARDRFMEYADKKWPAYGFSGHKGYPSEDHRRICIGQGLCPIHRRTFRIAPPKH